MENSTDFNFKLTNCLIRFNDPNGNFNGNLLYDFNDDTYYDNLFRNNDPEFLDPQNNKLQIPDGSSADGAAILFGILNNV